MWDAEGEDESLLEDSLYHGRKTHPRSRGRGAKAGASYATDGGLRSYLHSVIEWVKPVLMFRRPEDIRWDLLHGMVARLYYSRLTAVLYLGTLVLAGVLLAITLGLNTPLRDAPVALLGFEAIVSLSLSMEVTLRAIVLGKEYLRSWSNVMDVAVALASVSLMFWSAPRASRANDFEAQKEDVELSQSLVMLRIIVQFLRVLLITSHARRSRNAKNVGDISFGDLSSLMTPGQFPDFDFAVLQESELQEMHRTEDFGL